ncbi:MAG: peptidoglycan-associated lipoprotein Pal [Proteobacteria bacterium]|nr:peptidoglycan-associated lipoprotein Pal [Pseudomonadota bacterium]NDC24510.1 peptidoglycan-associated lipoprotein Pal [Pseudomonadota bacterium]NDD04449.1 peptidoglycan-associated lipoprotein Pal [Pseudomonadota bacterium]NDG26950.1 peptidoglycan-associated lipoprotein Pal [Pseudomonadota bacterium]
MNSSKKFLSLGFMILVLGVGITLSSCSKKDVVSDEPAMVPSEDSSGVATPGSSVDTLANPGDVGTAFNEMQVVYFGYDSFTLTGEGRDALKANADWMKANPSARIQIEGHCDERGTVEYNMALGDRRANAAKTFMTKLGVEGSRIDTISYGKERPADMGHSESAWAKNRRAVFVLLSK